MVIGTKQQGRFMWKLAIQRRSCGSSLYIGSSSTQQHWSALRYRTWDQWWRKGSNIDTCSNTACQHAWQWLPALTISGATRRVHKAPATRVRGQGQRGHVRRASGHMPPMARRGTAATRLPRQWGAKDATEHTREGPRHGGRVSRLPRAHTQRGELGQRRAPSQNL
jgi:hypothetical protein